MDAALADLLAVLAGLLVVVFTANDAVATLVTTRRRRGRHWPTQVFYRWTWRAWRAMGRRAEPALREPFLAVYGPLSMLGLLVVWVVLLVGGWGLVWWGLSAQVSGVGGFADALYFAGIDFFTVGFGDLVPTGGLARVLAVVQAFMGLTTMALVIGYLPTLYGAYSRREVQLLTLDDLSDDRVTSTGLVTSHLGAGGREAIAALFAAWERWCAEVTDSHTAYPMLAMFRSRQPGQHWLTALAVVADAAAICLAAVEGAAGGPAERLYRRATQLVQSLSAVPAIGLRAAELAGRPVDEAPFRAAYERLVELAVPLRPYPQAWDDLRRLRGAYVPELAALSELLLVPPEFHNPAVPVRLAGPE
jgi:hypothetical protein